MFYKEEEDCLIQLDQRKRNGFLAQRRRDLDYVCQCIAGDAKNAQKSILFPGHPSSATVRKFSLRGEKHTGLTEKACNGNGKKVVLK